MEFQNVKGTRDFYPQDMRKLNWIIDAWRRVSLRNGFEEYESPIFEYLDLFTAKSGQEIVEQLFSLTDRGGRQLAIRPEMTPSLARMVNARINSLPRPIKWFSISRVCRAENPQKGRLREFFQWNIDIVGEDSELADAECIFAAVDAMRELGLAKDDVSVRVGSRPLVVARLKAMGVGEAAIPQALAVIDKRPKVEDEEFEVLATKAGLTAEQIAQINAFERVPGQEAMQYLAAQAGGGADVEAGIAQVGRLWEQLRAMGIVDYCEFDQRIVRGLAYYTGVVYEIFDRSLSLRALAGGGRYDNLLNALGGPHVGATGFGMGDVVLGILLENKGKVPANLKGGRIEFFVVPGEDSAAGRVLEVVAALRTAGRSADFSYRSQGVGKLLKEANRRGAAKAVIVRKDGLEVKDLATGAQSPAGLADLAGGGAR
ncbi:MAG: histidine--tRNA ligase [Phycisphaerae bacterium]